MAVNEPGAGVLRNTSSQLLGCNTQHLLHQILASINSSCSCTLSWNYIVWIASACTSFFHADLLVNKFGVIWRPLPDVSPSLTTNFHETSSHKNYQQAPKIVPNSTWSVSFCLLSIPDEAGMNPHDKNQNIHLLVPGLNPDFLLHHQPSFLEPVVLIHSPTIRVV
jgi:hypothetical protein